MNNPLRSKKTRLYVEVGMLLLLAGTFAQLNHAKARSAAGDPDQIVAPWGNVYRSYVGSGNVTVGITRRSFTAGTGSGDHPDFRRVSTSGAGRFANIMSDRLSESGKPAFRSTGQRIAADWKDSGGNVISPPRSFIQAKPGDVAGQLDATPGDIVSSSSSFNQWFNDAPGVNTVARSQLVFNREGAGYTFNGSLDGPSGSSPDYTAEIEYPFVYEPGHDWYFSAATDAEIWVYVDGRLVIDGGGLRGVAFSISNGSVVPQQPVTASVTVVGTAIQSGSTLLPVTMSALVGDNTYAPFGLFTDPTRGNVRLASLPRTETLQNNVAAGTPISVSGTSWISASRGGWTRYMTASSAPANQQVKVLRNGDIVPDIRPFANQTSAATFLAPYINATTHRIVLRDDQAIFLFELGTTNMTSSAADFQDLVVLVNLQPTAGSNSGSGESSDSESALPMFSQRIALSRLGWLEDRGLHTIKVFFANRTGSPSRLRLDTNITTLNLANMRTTPGAD